MSAAQTVSNMLIIKPLTLSINNSGRLTLNTSMEYDTLDMVTWLGFWLSPKRARK